MGFGLAFFSDHTILNFFIRSNVYDMLKSICTRAPPRKATPLFIVLIC